MKTEPEECSIDDFANSPKSTIMWDGVRNYQARNFMRQMQVGDTVLIYHSSCKDIGIAGIVDVTQSAFDDPAQFDPNSDYYDPKSTVDTPRWSAIRLSFSKKFQQILSLQDIKANSLMPESPLTQKGSRLSVMPVTDEEFSAVVSYIRKKIC